MKHVTFSDNVGMVVFIIAMNRVRFRLSVHCVCILMEGVEIKKMHYL